MLNLRELLLARHTAFLVRIMFYLILLYYSYLVQELNEKTGDGCDDKSSKNIEVGAFCKHQANNEDCLRGQVDIQLLTVRKFNCSDEVKNKGDATFEEALDVN